MTNLLGFLYDDKGILSVGIANDVVNNVNGTTVTLAAATIPNFQMPVIRTAKKGCPIDSSLALQQEMSCYVTTAPATPYNF